MVQQQHAKGVLTVGIYFLSCEPKEKVYRSDESVVLLGESKQTVSCYDSRLFDIISPLE